MGYKTDTKTGLGYGLGRPREKIDVSSSDDPLQTAFLEWLPSAPTKPVDSDFWSEDFTSLYESAEKAIRKISYVEKTPPESIWRVLLPKKLDSRLSYSGIFLSACYNIIDAEEFVFPDIETDTPISHIGYALGKGKTLVIKADTGHRLGFKSEGTIVNYGKTDGNLCMGSSGRVINFGSVEDPTAGSGVMGGSGVRVNFGVVKEYGDGSGIGINHGIVEEEMPTHSNGVSINFGVVRGRMSPNNGGIAVNVGKIRGYMGHGYRPDAVNIAMKDPAGVFYKGVKMSLSEREAAGHPRLVKYFKNFGNGVGKYRGTDYPECIKVLDIVEQKVGTREKFEKKIRSLLEK